MWGLHDQQKTTQHQTGIEISFSSSTNHIEHTAAISRHSRPQLVNPDTPIECVVFSVGRYSRRVLDKRRGVILCHGVG